LNETPDGSGADARPRIALVAYVCGPDEGSEPGTGWAWARMLATFADVTLITLDEEPRAGETDRRIAALGLGDRIRHVTVPYPRWWLRALWRFERLSYVAWQLGMPTQVRRLGHQFDLAWHVTLANVWMGSAGYQLARRFVLGPVGGGVATPWGVVPALGMVGFLFEVRRTIARFAGRWVNPLSRAAWTHADLILAQNQETVSWLPADAQLRTVIFPHVVLEALRVDPRPSSRARAAGPEQDRARLVVTVGRLLPWKGIALAIRALSYLPGWRLTIIGDGPDRGRLERLADERGLVERIELTGWLSRDVVQERLLEADVLLFPSLHDEGGWASAEAVAAGIPAVSLDRGGPPVLGARGVRASSPERTARAIARAAREALSSGRPVDDTWAFDRRRDALVALLRERGLLSP
jgi:glycosyltransferase involved in cell wall biosynthesis